MGKPAVLLRHKLISLCAAGLLACGLAPFAAYAVDDDSVAASFVLADSKGSGEAATPNSSSAESQQVSAFQDAGTSRVAPMLASGLFGTPTSFVSSDVALDSADPIVGSFTVDGLTYAVGSDGLTLVAVDAAASDGALDVPASVIYNGVTYPVTAVGPYAFYLSGATDVALPDSIVSVDDRAFRSSDVARIEVDPANPNLASFDGALYDAPLNRLLLIPEGRKGSVLLSCETEVVQASLFSHCSLVETISVEEGGAAFASENGLLYTSDGTTLLRVPAGATDITIRDGCTTIAAGALEGCAKLERINAPASVVSISPDVFESVPTVGLPAQMAVQDGTNPGVASALADQVKESTDSSGAEGEAEVSPRRVVASSQGLEAPLALPDLGSTSASPSSEASGSAPQLTAMVALSAAANDLPEVDPSSIEVILPRGSQVEIWQAFGFERGYGEASDNAITSVGMDTAVATNSAASTFASLNVPGPTSINVISSHRFSRRSSWEGGIAAYEVGQYDWIGTQSRFDELKFVRLMPYDSTSSFIGLVGQRDATIPPPFDHANCQNTVVAWWHCSDDDRAKVACDVGATITWPDGTSEPMYYGAGEYDLPQRGMLVTLHPGVDVRIRLYGADGNDAELIQSLSTLSCTDLPKADVPVRAGYAFKGYFDGKDGTGTQYYDGQGNGVKQLTTREEKTTRILYAQWERVDFDVGFDVDSEPGDADYPGDKKDDQTVNKDSGAVEIEDPKRPGYVFEGWAIPNTGGTEAVDQDLVYKGDDDKWYVDASKLPDYAGDDGRVELTARWTSVISVDVPSSVTFYADLVTQGQESREGAASSAFGQSKVENQSEIDLRVVGLESSAVKTTDTTLGADSILKKASTATPSTSTQKLLSLYPSTKAWTADDLKDPDAVGGTKAAMAVDFDLDDILLEKSFKADDFTIAAGGTLNMGYRLNLKESGQQLDYDKLDDLEEGQSASIANISYCFAADALPSDWDEPLWIENPDRTSNPAKYLLLDDIKAAANDLSAKGAASEYYSLYKGLLDKQVMSNGNPGAGPYFQLKVDGVYLPLQLIGICQDTKSDGTGKAGLTFQMRDIYAYDNKASTAAGGDTFSTYMNSSNTNSGGWQSAAMRTQLRSAFWGYLPAETQAAIVGVDKFQQLPSGTTASYLQKTTGETIWLPSMYEVFGTSFAEYNESEALTSVSGYTPFQYMAYQGNAGSETNAKAVKTYNGSASHWWLRSAVRNITNNFCLVVSYGYRGNNLAYIARGTAPCFCL